MRPNTLLTLMPPHRGMERWPRHPSCEDDRTLPQFFEPEKKWLRTTGLVLSTLMFCVGAEANNYVFFDQQPLAVVSAKGDFESFELGTSDEDGSRMVIDKRLAASLGTLWMYPAAGDAQRTKSKVVSGYAGCDHALLVETEDKDYRGLLSSKRLPVASAPLSKASASALQGQGRELLSASLKKHKLSPQRIASLLKNATVTPVVIAPKGPVSLVISASDELNNRTATAFLVATPDARGHHVVSKEDVRTGTASDSEGYAGTMELAAHADFDGDGVQELVVRQSAYESFGVHLWRWSGSEWVSVASNGGGC